MKTIEGRIKDIKEELDLIEAQASHLRKMNSTDERVVIEWMIRQIRYAAQIARDTENRPGKNKSYATTTRRMRQQLELVIRRVEGWDTSNEPFKGKLY